MEQNLSMSSCALESWYDDKLTTLSCKFSFELETTLLECRTERLYLSLRFFFLLFLCPP